MSSSLVDLSTAGLDFVLCSEGDRLSAWRLAADGHSWLHPVIPGDLFRSDINGQPCSAQTLRCEAVTTDHTIPGVLHAVAQFGGDGFQIDHHIQVYQAAALMETWQIIRNVSGHALHVTRLDSLSWSLPQDNYELLYYASDWGQEFEPVRAPLTAAVTLETRFGRSSKGQHPWFALFSPAGSVLSGAVAWSGNWALRFEPLSAGGWRVSGGLHDWAFATDLLPGHTLESPPVIVALGDTLNAISQQYARVGRQHWYPRNSLAAQLPVEWNHWWSYEDADINHSVFAANVAAADALGIEVCTLDAGWFGPDGRHTAWHDYRGDWHTVNADRFPRGIRALSDEAHANGLAFGLWCEIEGLGQSASLAATRPELVAKREDEPLGYVCLGNPQAQDWAYETLCRLITDYNCDWIKLDFNVDPGAGCSRTDHGHGAGDGLYEHIRGTYRTLERIRCTFPEVVLESCSSGGLRIDLGLLRRTHMTFLSDPDWPVHDLQVFWGASTMLAPDACLHWSFSEWRGGGPPQQTFNPRDPRLQPHQLDYFTRTAMLGRFGLSQKLPDLPGWVADRLAAHGRVYRDHVRRFVREADLYRLTDQPRRDGHGDRWCAFQYSLPDRSEHLLFVFRLPGAEPTRTLQLAGLSPDRVYQVAGFEGETLPAATGHELTHTGITFVDLPEEGSALLRLY